MVIHFSGMELFNTQHWAVWYPDNLSITLISLTEKQPSALEGVCKGSWEMSTLLKNICHQNLKGKDQHIDLQPHDDGFYKRLVISLNMLWYFKLSVTKQSLRGQIVKGA